MPEHLSFGGAPEGGAPRVAREVNYEQPKNGEVAGSLMDQLRIAAKEQQKTHTVDMPVGGAFGKRLMIRYQPLEPGAMDRYITRRGEIRERQEADPRLSIPFTELNMDLMAQACSAVVGADEQGENKTVLEDGMGKVRLEHRLATMLGFPVPAEIQMTAHDVIMALFGGNALAIVDHGDDLLAWLRDPTEQPDVGKS